MIVAGYIMVGIGCLLLSLTVGEIALVPALLAAVGGFLIGAAD